MYKFAIAICATFATACTISACNSAYVELGEDGTLVGEQYHPEDDDAADDDAAGDDDSFGDDDAAGDDDIADDDAADDDSFGDDDAADDDTTGDDDTADPELCTDLAGNLFGADCGFEQGNASDWVFEQAHSQRTVVCGDGNAYEGDCYLSLTMLDDEGLTLYDDQAYMVLPGSDLPLGAQCEFTAEAMVVGDSSFVYQAQFMEHGGSWQSVTAEFSALDFVVYSSWTEITVDFTVTVEYGNVRVAVAQYGNMPEWVELRLDNHRLVCQ